MEERFNRVVAFVSGDVLVMFLSAGGFSFYQESWHFVIKALVTLLLGMVGGLGGLLIKDLYPVIKKWVKEKLAKW